MFIYYLGSFWNQQLEPTDISAVWESNEFKDFDLFMKQNKNQIIKSTQDHLEKSKELSLLDFDRPHQNLMNASPNKDSWKIVFLKYFGKRVVKSGILSKICQYPIVYNASISILESNGVIPPHVGQCKGLVKYHFPIDIPEGDLGMLYDNVIYKWEERALFDDTHLHSVWNYTSKRRIILLFDLIRPMPFPWNILNERVLSLAWLDKSVREHEYS